MRAFELPLLFAVFMDMLCAWMLFPDLQLRTQAWGAPGWATGFILASFYPAQLIAAPFWSKFSRENGIKWAVVGTLVLSALACMGYMLAESIWLLWLSRIVGGIGGATLLLAESALSDSAEPYERPAALGRLGAMALAGFVLGPAVGGLLGDVGGNFLLGAAGFISLSAAAVLVGVALPKIGAVPVREGTFRFSRQLLDNPTFRRLVSVGIVAWIGYAALEATAGLLMRANFHAGAFAFGLFLTFAGVFAAGGRILLDPALSRFEPAAKLRFCLIGLGLVLLLLPSTGSMVRVLVIGSLAGLLWGVVTKSLQQLAEERIHPLEAVDAPGAFRMAMSAAFVLGPILGGLLFDFARYAPFVVGGIALIAAAASERIFPAPIDEYGVEPVPGMPVR
jgi:MFS family permease